MSYTCIHISYILMNTCMFAGKTDAVPAETAGNYN